MITKEPNNVKKLYLIEGIKITRDAYEHCFRFSEYTRAVSEKQALNNVRYRLSGYYVRDVSVTEQSVPEPKPKSVKTKKEQYEQLALF